MRPTRSLRHLLLLLALLTAAADQCAALPAFVAGSRGTVNDQTADGRRDEDQERVYFFPGEGIYPTTQRVTVFSGLPEVPLFYTTDGTPPNRQSQRYTRPIRVDSSQTLRVAGFRRGGEALARGRAVYTIQPPSVSTAQYDFGESLIASTVTRTVATITNSLSEPAPVRLSLTGDGAFALVSSASCGERIAANSSCPLVVAYDPGTAGTQSAALQVQFRGGPLPAPIALTGTAAAAPSGSVANTINPQVAQYTIAPPFDANVTVEFGLTPSYGLTTSARPAPAGGGPVTTLVAGMLANSTYHMRAQIQFANGMTYTDADHTFTTGAVPPGITPALTASTTPGLTPQPGIELLDTYTSATPSAAIATDLAGNVIWTYPFPDRQPMSEMYPVKLLPNGNFLTELTYDSVLTLAGAGPANPLVELREFDLAGNTVRSLPMADLNAKLAAAGFPDLRLLLYSHDVTLLPNGHMLVNAIDARTFQDLPSHPGATTVYGDVVVDLDPGMNPVWVWNAFDHLDVNRQPMGFPDWTHANAITYSPDDGNFLISFRHQNWIVKVDYNHGQGDGGILWKLGYQGDFALQGGTDPTDWFYAQHNPSFFSQNTTGVFSLGIMDNGDDRLFPDGTNCLVQGGALCYTTISVMQVDETAKTATLTTHQILPADRYNIFAGDIFQLPNGNLEYNLAGVGHNAFILEETQTPTPETVWQMSIEGTNTYRAFRLPSLYPGVTWPATP